MSKIQPIFFLVSAVSLIPFRSLWLHNAFGVAAPFKTFYVYLCDDFARRLFSPSGSLSDSRHPLSNCTLSSNGGQLRPFSPSASLMVSAERGRRILMIKAEAETFCNQNSLPLSAERLSRSSLAEAERCHFPLIVSDSFLHL